MFAMYFRKFNFTTYRRTASSSVCVCLRRRWYCSAPGLESCISKKIVLPIDPVDNNSNVVSSVIGSRIKFSRISGLNDDLVRRLEKLGYNSAFEVQAETLPYTLNGRDVIGRAVTGSGKTLAFAIPIVQTLQSSVRSRNPRAIVIAPTRELCKQVMEAIDDLSASVRCVALYGGDSYYNQESKLRRGVDVICATPGRLNDHLARGNIVLNEIKFLVLDEADELLRPSFKEQIVDVLNDTPSDKQMMLFSATMPTNIRDLINEHMSNPVTVNLVKNKSIVPTSVSHELMMIQPFSGDRVVVHLICSRNPERAIVFTQTKLQASSLARFLVSNGISATSLHSDLSQSVRESCLQSFRDGSTKVIVATDVAARGIDIPEIDLVIQLGQPPSGMDYYIHRSGRTGRKGQAGTSIVLLDRSPEADAFLFQLRKLIDIKVMSPPSYKEILVYSMRSAVLAIKNIDPKLSFLARNEAEELLRTHGVDALSSAIAVIANLRVKASTQRKPQFSRGVSGRQFGGQYSSQFSDDSRSYRRYNNYNKKPKNRFGYNRKNFEHVRFDKGR